MLTRLSQWTPSSRITFSSLRPASSALFQPVDRFGLRVRVAREINYSFENDRKQLRVDMAKQRKEHRENYWRMQTLIENKNFEDLRADMKKVNRQRMDQWRTSICTIAKNTKDKIDHLQRREEKRLESMRMQDIKNMRKSVGNTLMLDGLEMEAQKSWPTLANLSAKIEADVVIPQTILNYPEYTTKLQRLAIFSEMGNLEAMQDVLDNKLVLQRKNQLLQPIFRDIKSQIRHMSFTPEFEIMRDYVAKRKQIEQSVKGRSNEAWCEQSLAQLQELHAILIAKRQESIRASLSLRLKTLQKRLEQIFELLNLWQQYVEVIYMPEAEVHMLEQISQMEGRLPEESYGRMMKSEDVSKRLKMLFKPEDHKPAESVQSEDALDQDYQTVNEDETTDTTSGVEDEALLAGTRRVAPEAISEIEKAASMKKAVEEGIKSSDEEEEPLKAPQEQANVQAEEATPKETAVNDPKVERDLSEKVMAFESNKSMFPDGKEREQLEHNYGFSKQTIESYSAVLEGRLETLARDPARTDAASKRQEEEEDFEMDFIGGRNLKEELQDLDQRVGDLESLNLFGVEMSSDSIMRSVDKRNKGASKQEIHKVLTDLVQMVSEVDPNGVSRDFAKRKSFVYYDPYNPDSSASFAHLRYEDEAKMRASLIVQQHLEAIQEIETHLDSSRASVADFQRFESIKQMLDRLSDMKITDPQVLLKLYNLYRYKVEEQDQEQL